MSEERIVTPMEQEPEMAAQEPGVGEAPRRKLDEELQELGKQLTNATRAVLESPEAKELGAQIQRGLESLEKAVNRLSSQARETEVGQKVESGVQEAAEAVRERRVVESAADSIARALHAVNKALGQVVEKAEAHAEESKAEPQQIEIVDTEPTE